VEEVRKIYPNRFVKLQILKSKINGIKDILKTLLLPCSRMEVYLDFILFFNPKKFTLPRWWRELNV